MEERNQPPLESLACINHECRAYGKADAGNLVVRKVYGRDQLRLLRCKACGKEFNERKQTPLWNCKLPEEKAVAIAEQLAEGTSYKGTTRVVKVSAEAVRRLAGCLGKHGRHFHDEQVHNLTITALQADERWGFAGSKGEQVWEADVIDPKSRLVVERAQGARDEVLIRQLLQGARKKLAYPQGVVLFSDGEASYKTLFPQVFGITYRLARNGSKGRFPKPKYRLGRRQAHVQVVKRRQGRRVVKVEVRYAHGSRKRVQRELVRLGYSTPNTSVIEHRNGTARSMDASMVRKTLAFVRSPETREARGW